MVSPPKGENTDPEADIEQQQMDTGGQCTLPKPHSWLRILLPCWLNY